MHVCGTVLIVWITENSLMDLVLSFYGVLGIELKYVRLIQQTLYQQSHWSFCLTLCYHPRDCSFINTCISGFNFSVQVEPQKETPGALYWSPCQNLN